MTDRPVIAIGEILIDLIAPAGVTLLDASELRIREGGAPANVAVALARLGVPSQLRAVVGDDPFGERLVARLEREGVDVSCIRTASHEATTLALAWSDARGDGHFRLLRNADRLLSPDDVAAESLAGAEAIVVGSVAMCAEPSKTAVLTALRHATGARIPVVADLNIRPGQMPMDELRLSVTAMIGAATVVKLSVVTRVTCGEHRRSQTPLPHWSASIRPSPSSPTERAVRPCGQAASSSPWTRSKSTPWNQPVRAMPLPLRSSPA